MPEGEMATGASTMVPDMAPGTGSKMGNGMVGPAVLGMLAFGMMSILFGLSQLPGPYSTGFNVNFYIGLWSAGPVVTGTMTTLGGYVLIVIGAIVFLKSGHAFWGSTFFGYGAFWVVWGSLAGSATSHTTYGYGIAAFFLIWLLFTVTYLISSFKHGWPTFLFFLILTISVALMLVQGWQWGAKPASPISGDELAVIGGFWILAGILGWYGGTARLAEYTYGKKILPM